MIDPVSIITDSWNYLIVICLMMGGLFIVISQNNLVKKLVGLAIFQTSVFLFYITVGKMAGGTAPILLDSADVAYSNPLPHVLILTAIVVGVATTALGLALVLRIHAAFGSIEDDEVLTIKAEAALPRVTRAASETDSEARS
ncbi:MAG: Na+/H+ antiporter subunit C [Rhodospirillaceae bacterium]|nr:Na+/H+ antiporter subunit C [Rhodospirillaceae bacterium]MEC8661466.1 cation:proton antiporter subunit C [Pseudomonadota bacterium]|tara:strand:+ start:114 stop:539 length:426 start_codon:yes stop_codon:yes gene_type:complete